MSPGTSRCDKDLFNTFYYMPSLDEVSSAAVVAGANSGPKADESKNRDVKNVLPVVFPFPRGGRKSDRTHTAATGFPKSNSRKCSLDTQKGTDQATLLATISRRQQLLEFCGL